MSSVMFYSLNMTHSILVDTQIGSESSTRISSPVYEGLDLVLILRLSSFTILVVKEDNDKRQRMSIA